MTPTKRLHTLGVLFFCIFAKIRQVIFMVSSTQFGNRIKELREKNNLLQRQLASMLDIDTPLYSKIERGERKAKKELVIMLSNILNTKTEELLALWLADQLVLVVQDEDYALKAMRIAENVVKSKKNKISANGAKI